MADADTDPLDALNPRQRLFVEGLAKGMAQSEAYIAAGYKARGPAAESKASRLVRVGKVAAALASIQKTTPDIADKAERQQFLTAMMRGNAADRDKLKACELLGKMGGDFIEKREVEHKGAMPVVVLPSNGREGG